MKTLKVVMAGIMILTVLLIACEPEEDKPPPDIGCYMSPAEYDFGSVAMGSDSLRQMSVQVYDPGATGLTIQDTLTIDHPEFHLYDYNLGQLVDTIIFDIDVNNLQFFGVQFSPLSEGYKMCEVDAGADCPVLVVTGRCEVPGTWSTYDPVTVFDLNDVWGNSDAVFACGNEGVVIRKLEAEDYWTVMTGTGIPQVSLNGMWCSDPANWLWIGGGVMDGGFTHGLIYIYDTIDDTWDEFHTDSQLDMIGSVWASNNCDIYFGGSAFSGFFPNMEHWDCFTFENFIIGMEYSLVSGISGSGPADIWTVQNTSSDSLYHYDGTVWEPTKESFMTEGLNDIWVFPGGEAVAVGNNGAIYYYSSNTWTDQSLPAPADNLNGVWGISPASIFAVGDNAAIYHYNGSEWVPEGAPPGVTSLNAVFGRDIGALGMVVYAVGDGGKVIRRIGS